MCASQGEATKTEKNMQLWPAIDILNGKCVRLTQGDYAQKTIYADSPVEMAQHWVSLGAQFLHVVDLDGAKDKTPVNRVFVEKIAETVNIPIEIGGGIRNGFRASERICDRF